jgi:PAS domain S-box-containing protein
MRHGGEDDPILVPLASWSPVMRGGLLHRFAWGTLAGLLVSSLVFLVLYIGMYRSELAQERAGVAENVNRLLLASLENAMLKADVEGLQQIIEDLGRQPGIVAVNVTGPDGEVRFASERARIGEPFPEPFVMPEVPTTKLLVSASGTEVLRSMIPVLNRPACVPCHGSIDARPVNGLLMVDYEAEPVRRKVRNTTLMLMSAGALIVVLNLLGGWWFMQRFVLRPVNALTAVSARLRQGDLSARVNLRSGDELAHLGDTFNGMAEELRNRLTQLEEQRGFLQGIVDAIPDGLRVLDSDYRQILVNRAYLEQLGTTREEATGSLCFASSHARSEPCPPTLQVCPVFELQHSDIPIKILESHVRQDGTRIEVEVFAAPMRVTIDGQEQRLIVESLRDLQSHLRYSQEQRLSEVGKLAAGIAHEVFNPLSSLRMVIHGLRGPIERGEVGPTELGDLDIVEHEIEKCIKVTQGLLKLSNLPTDQPEPVDLASAIRETLALLRLEAKVGQVELIADLPEEPVWVMASDSALRMITLNLAQNAIHALSPAGGILRVSLERHGGRVWARFEDNGPGIRKESLKHLFEPFFSRRADGLRGTGLGLSICRSLVEQYGGEIGVETEPGQGARFTVTFAEPYVATLTEDT